MINNILDILNSFSKLDKRYQIKYISPADYIELAKELDALFDLRGVAVTFKEKHTLTFEKWFYQNYTIIGSFIERRNTQKFEDIVTILNRYREEVENQP